MAFIPHSERDVAEMLAAIGAGSIEQLFDEIPASPARENRWRVCRSR